MEMIYIYVYIRCWKKVRRPSIKGEDMNKYVLFLKLQK